MFNTSIHSFPLSVPLGFAKISDMIISSIDKTLSKKLVTYDFERQMNGATLLKCSEFGEALIDNM